MTSLAFDGALHAQVPRRTINKFNSAFYTDISRTMVREVLQILWADQEIDNLD